MIKLIVNVDDFGYSSGMNYATIDCHTNGIVNSTTMMMNMPGTKQAIELAKKHPTLKVGIHLVLTCGAPLSQNVPSLVGADGNFRKLGDVTSNGGINLDELEREWTTQIERFIASGLHPNHFDSHHHVHTLNELQPVIAKLAKKYNVPVRVSEKGPIEGTRPYTDVLDTEFYGDTATFEYFEKLTEKYKDGTVVEVMTHPAYLDHALLVGSSYNLDRIKELDILTTVELPNKLRLL
jgi:chitin disaccharide deacetylase